MIHIAFIVHSLQPGGIERSVTRIVNGIDPAKFRSSIICLTKSGPAEKWLTRDVPIIEIDKRSGNDFQAMRRLSHVLRSTEVDVVQSHNWGTLLETVVARKLAKTPRHVHAERGTVMGTVAPQGFRHWVRAKTMALALKSVDRVMSNANAVAKRVEQRCGFPASRITIVPNGVPAISCDERRECRQRIRQRLDLRGDDFVVGSVGRLAEVKGFDVALRSFAQLRQLVPNAHFLLVGDGSEQSALKQMAQDLDIDQHVHFVGHQERPAEWMAAMDVFVNSSRSEGMSQSIVEAMSLGLPIVATDVGDNATMIDTPEYRCGIICPSEAPDAMTKALHHLATNGNDREQFSDRAAKCHAHRYSESRFCASLENLYQGLFSGHDGAPATASTPPPAEVPVR